MSSISLEFVHKFYDDLARTTVSIDLVADGKLRSPAELRAQIKRPLELIEFQKWHHWLRQHWSLRQRRRQEALPPLIFLEYPRVHSAVPLMFPCVTFACQRLATAPANMHIALMSWSWAEMVMERVTRGRVKKVQVRLQRRACCAVRCACRDSACVRCVFDASAANGG